MIHLSSFFYPKLRWSYPFEIPHCSLNWDHCSAHTLLFQWSIFKAKDLSPRTQQHTMACQSLLSKHIVILSPEPISISFQVWHWTMVEICLNLLCKFALYQQHIFLWSRTLKHCLTALFPPNLCSYGFKAPPSQITWSTVTKSTLEELEDEKGTLQSGPKDDKYQV